MAARNDHGDIFCVFVLAFVCGVLLACAYTYSPVITYGARGFTVRSHDSYIRAIEEENRATLQHELKQCNDARAAVAEWTRSIVSVINGEFHTLMATGDKEFGVILHAIAEAAAQGKDSTTYRFNSKDCSLVDDSVQCTVEWKENMRTLYVEKLKALGFKVITIFILDDGTYFMQIMWV
jgi:hypothetical protein